MPWHWKEPGATGKRGSLLSTRQKAATSAVHYALSGRGGKVRYVSDADLPTLWHSMQGAGWEIEYDAG